MTLFSWDKKAKNIWLELSIASGLSMITTIIGTLTIAWLIIKRTISTDLANTWVKGTLFSAAFIGAYTSTRRIQRKKLLVGITSSLVYLAILLTLNYRICNGRNNTFFATAIMVLSGTIGAIMVNCCVNKGMKTDKSRRRYR